MFFSMKRSCIALIQQVQLVRERLNETKKFTEIFKFSLKMTIFVLHFVLHEETFSK